MWNSLIVALSVVVLNLLVAVPAAYAMAKIRFIGRSTSIYFMLTTRVIPDIALVVPFFLFIRKLRPARPPRVARHHLSRHHRALQHLHPA